MKNLGSEYPSKFQKWMQCPNVEIYYPGLAYLWPLEELIVADKIDALHDVIGKNDANYTIFNNLGEKVFLAVQKKRCHKFDVKIFNFYGNEVIHVRKPHKCCVQKALVWAPPENYIGSIKKVGCGVYLVRNKMGEPVLKIKAQLGIHYVYDMVAGDKVVGVVKWQMAVFDAKNFGVAFPVDMDVKDKAVLLGACFLIGYLKYRI